MKIVFFALLCLILIGITSYSYAQFTDVNKSSKGIILPEVLVQEELRDIHGNLFAYFESDQIISISPLELNKFLDNQNQTNKEFIMKDGQKYERHQWEIKGDKFKTKHAFSSTKLLDVQENTLVTLITMRHDSFQTQPGDKSRVFWTLERPAN